MSDQERAAVLIAAAMIVCLAILLTGLIVHGGMPKQECTDSRGRAAFCRVSP